MRPSMSILCEPLDERTVLGVGRVAEYGITARWDKVHTTDLSIFSASQFLCAQRQRALWGDLSGRRCLGPWLRSFSHCGWRGLAKGAAHPRIDGLHGMRQANDFLMALQLTGAAQVQV